MVTIAIASGKGGTGKTATAFHLAHLLSDRSRVLAVDLDPQASLTWALNVESPAQHFLSDSKRIRSAVVELSPTLHVLPSSLSLVGVEIALASKIARETALRHALEALSSSYDVALIDTGPAMGVLSINALAASEGVLLPIIPDGLSLHAVGAFLTTVEEVRAVNPSLELVGIVANMLSEQLTHHAAGIAAIEAAGLRVVGKIGRSVKVAEAMAAHEPITTYEPHNPRAEEFKQLTGEIRKWLRQHQKSQ